MGTRGRKGPKESTLRGDDLLAELDGCLSQEERRHVLAAALLALDEGGRERMIGRLGEDTGAILLHVLEAKTGRGWRRSVRPSRSQERILQDWHAAWSEWNSAIGETQWEHGKYISQERHWEPPYIDQSTLTDDLEAVARRLLELMPRVIEDDLDPDVSCLDQLQGSAEDVGDGLPEWFDEPEWEYLYGPVVTSCLLHWEWFSLDHDARGGGEASSPFEILDRIRSAEDESGRWGVDAGALFEFVQALEEEDQRDILHGIEAHRTSPHWHSALERAHGTWFDLVRELAQALDPSTHLSLCRERVQSDWTLAIPVLEDLLERRAFGEAGPVIEDAVSSLFRHTAAGQWSPEEALLVARRYSHHARDSENPLEQLLLCWARVAEGLGETELHHALEIQVVAQQGWERWDPVLAAFERATKAGFDALADRLFEDWKQLVTRRTDREGGIMRGGIAARRRALLALRAAQQQAEPKSWVPLLVDAARTGRGEAGRFCESLGAWIEDAAATAPREAFEQHRRYLETLTLDLDDGALLRRASRTLHDTLARERGEATDLDASRRSWLERLGARRLFPAVIGAWTRHAAELPDDPRGGDYLPCARWLKITFELDRDASERVLATWRVDHRRRRNLWKALKEQGLSFDGR